MLWYTIHCLKTGVAHDWNIAHIMQWVFRFSLITAGNTVTKIGM